MYRNGQDGAKSMTPLSQGEGFDEKVINLDDHTQTTIRTTIARSTSATASATTSGRRRTR